jgi:subtilisin family serine protease
VQFTNSGHCDLRHFLQSQKLTLCAQITNIILADAISVIVVEDTDESSSFLLGSVLENLDISDSFYVVSVSRTDGAALLENDYNVHADIYGKPDFSSNDIAEFSSIGPTNDGRMKPDLTAPGKNIFSAYSDAKPYSFQCRDSAFGEGASIASMDGTSMATPIVAGAAALVRQYLRDGYYPSGVRGSPSVYPSSALMRAILMNSAVPLSGNQMKSSLKTGIQENKPLTPTPSFEQG